MAEAVVAEKRCGHCKKIKTVAEFYCNRSSKDGLGRNCKRCSDDATRRSKNTPEGRRNASDRVLRYQKTEKGRRHIHKQYAKDVASGVYAARNAVGYAIRRGKLVPAKTLKCIRCQKQSQHYHHHLGYEREHFLDVVPVCAACHKSIEGSNLGDCQPV